jgi:UDP-glucose 4-epimerase
VKVLITGAAGRLGRQISHRLSEFDLVCLDYATPVDGSHVNWVRADIGSIGDLVTAMEGAQIVVHLAAMPDPVPTEDYGSIFEVNVRGTLNVLQAARLSGVIRVVMASSICATGLIYWHHPWSPRYLPLDEEHPCWPDDNYGTSKLICEAIARGFHVRHGMEIVALRLCGVFFPEDPWSVSRYETWLTDPSGELVNRLWSYVVIDDVVDAFYRSVTEPSIGFEILNVAAPDSAVGSSDIAALVGAHYPDLRQDALRVAEEHGPTAPLISTARATNILGWRPTRSLRDHLSRPSNQGLR